MLVEGNDESLAAVIGDSRIDDLQIEIDRRYFTSCAVSAVAIDLRTVVSALKINTTWSALAIWPSKSRGWRRISASRRSGR
jgi:hypothetical protein